MAYCKVFLWQIFKKPKLKPTIPGKIFGTKWNNPVKLDR